LTESGESACAPAETNVLLNRPADDLIDFARRILRRPSCFSFLRRRRRYKTSPKSRLRPRMRGLSRHVAVSQGSNRGLCVVAHATGSNRRGTSTNALNDRVLCSTDSSLDGLIRSPSLPHWTINRKGEPTMHFCKCTTGVALLLWVVSAVPSSFRAPAHPFPLFSLSSCDPGPTPLSANAPKTACSSCPQLVQERRRHRSIFRPSNPRRVVVDGPILYTQRQGRQQGAGDEANGPAADVRSGLDHLAARRRSRRRFQKHARRRLHACFDDESRKTTLRRQPHGRPT
jgi:hypothetical protein